MKSILIGLLSMSLAGPLAARQNPAAAQPTPTPQKSVSSQLGLHAFPAKGQNPEQQQTDELACYSWAQQDTGFDPLAALMATQPAKSPPPATEASPAAASQRAGAKGAAKSAAGGAVIGAIAGDPKVRQSARPVVASEGDSPRNELKRKHNNELKCRLSNKLNSNRKQGHNHKLAWTVSRGPTVPAWRRRDIR